MFRGKPHKTQIIIRSIVFLQVINQIWMGNLSKSKEINVQTVLPAQ